MFFHMCVCVCVCVCVVYTWWEFFRNIFITCVMCIDNSLVQDFSQRSVMLYMCGIRLGNYSLLCSTSYWVVGTWLYPVPLIYIFSLLRCSFLSFRCLISLVLFPCASVGNDTRAWASLFIAIPNGTWFFCSAISMKMLKYSAVTISLFATLGSSDPSWGT